MKYINSSLSYYVALYFYSTSSFRRTPISFFLSIIHLIVRLLANVKYVLKSFKHFN